LDVLRNITSEALATMGSWLGALRELLETALGRLASPAAVWLLAAQPVLWVFAIRAWYGRRRDLRRLGTALALRGLTAPARGWNTLRNFCWSTGVTALILGIAGPRWGSDPSQHAAAGRDLVVVLDLSRSMLAEQPSRQERARRALFDLADSLQRRGGHRVALVVFAARAKLVCPLTHDYDHFREAVRRQDADSLPADLRPLGEGQTSGTRIGAGLRAAVAALDPSSGGLHDILLVSDGDDPAGDEEWADGVAAAKEAGVAVWCVGVGDPAVPSTIPTPTGPQSHGGDVVKTQLEEFPLQEIARRTGGTYFAARTRSLPPGALYREILAGRARRATVEVLLTVYRPRYAWFFGTALALLAVSLFVGGGRPAKPRRQEAAPAGRHARAVVATTNEERP
jgi:Ca-activated chloride channel family protein